MGEVQKAGLFFHPDSFPYEANDIASKWGVFMDGGAVRVKYEGKEVIMEEVFLAGEEEAVEKAWEEISKLPECITSGIEFYSKKEMEATYAPIFNQIIEDMKREE